MICKDAKPQFAYSMINRICLHTKTLIVLNIIISIQRYLFCTTRPFFHCHVFCFIPSCNKSRHNMKASLPDLEYHHFYEILARKRTNSCMFCIVLAIDSLTCTTQPDTSSYIFSVTVFQQISTAIACPYLPVVFKFHKWIGGGGL